jgi:hypothetical protein
MPEASTFWFSQLGIYKYNLIRTTELQAKMLLAGVYTTVFWQLYSQNKISNYIG